MDTSRFTYLPCRLAQHVSVEQFGGGYVKVRVDEPVVEGVRDPAAAVALFSRLNELTPASSWAYDPASGSMHVLAAASLHLAQTSTLVELAEAVWLGTWFADLAADEAAARVGGSVAVATGTDGRPRPEPDAVLTLPEALGSRPEWVFDTTPLRFPPIPDIAEAIAAATGLPVQFDEGLTSIELGPETGAPVPGALELTFAIDPLYGHGFATAFSLDCRPEQPLDQWCQAGAWALYRDRQATLLGNWRHDGQSLLQYRQFATCAQLRAFEQVSSFTGHDAQELWGLAVRAVRSAGTGRTAMAAAEEVAGPAVADVGATVEAIRSPRRPAREALRRPAAPEARPVDRSLLWADTTPLFTTVVFNPMGPTTTSYGITGHPDTDAAVLLRLMRHPFMPTFDPIAEIGDLQGLHHALVVDLLDHALCLPHAVLFEGCPDALVDVLRQALTGYAAQMAGQDRADLPADTWILQRNAGNPWGLATVGGNTVPDPGPQDSAAGTVEEAAASSRRQPPSAAPSRS